ncbi:17914_t:CDS:1, partial [Gigaspora margarita]
KIIYFNNPFDALSKRLDRAVVWYLDVIILESILQESNLIK